MRPIKQQALFGPGWGQAGAPRSLDVRPSQTQLAFAAVAALTLAGPALGGGPSPAAEDPRKKHSKMRIGARTPGQAAALAARRARKKAQRQARRKAG